MGWVRRSKKPAQGWRVATTVFGLAMAEALGATRTLEKPFKYSELVRLVQECLASC